MMMWVALAFTTGTLFIVSVEDEGIMVDGCMLVSPSSTCAEEARYNLREKREDYPEVLHSTFSDPDGDGKHNKCKRLNTVLLRMIFLH